MADLKCKMLVIGAGPGGYVCAIRAGQLGLDTIIVEADRLGGTCLNVGCIPSKALIHAAEEFYKLRMFADRRSALGISSKEAAIEFAITSEWINGVVNRLKKGVGALLKKAGVRTVFGTARFLDGKTVTVTNAEREQRIHAETIVIATGSVASELPELPFGGDVVSSTEALSLTQIPEHLAVIGAGYIGLEIGTAFAKLGAKVTIIEAQDRILPQYEAAIAAPVADRVKVLGINVFTSARALNFGDGMLEIEGRDPVRADKVLVAVGRRSRTGQVGLKELDLTMMNGFISIDERCRTSMRGVYAIGDVTGEPMLAHRAMAQGDMVAKIVAGEIDIWDKRAIPAVCFTDPEIVAVGLSSMEAANAGHEIIVEQFPFAANGRAMTTERDEGFVRVVANKRDNVVLGIQAVGDSISELSSTFAIALEMGATLEDVAATIHAHPTRSESFHEAVHMALGQSLHI